MGRIRQPHSRESLGKLKALARLLHKKRPSAQELAAAGLRPEDYADDDKEAFEVWPENWATFEMWETVKDQWIMGSVGPVALNLMPVFHELDRAGLGEEEYDHLLTGIKTMAAVALDEIQSQVSSK